MYLQQAFKGKTGLWDYLTILFFVIALFIIAQIPAAVVAYLKVLSNGGNPISMGGSLNFEGVGISQNMGMILIFGPFAIVFFALAFVMKSFLNINLAMVFTAYKKFRWKNFLFAAGLWLLFLVITDAVNYSLHPENYVFSFNGKSFIGLVLVSIVFIPFQASFEELMFRGYLMQGFGLITKNRLAAILISGIGFGLVHLSNPEVGQFGVFLAMVQYISFGLLLAVLVVMDGGLEMAFGLHSINNIYLLTIVTYEGSVIETRGVFKMTEVDPRFMTLAFLVFAILFVFISSKIFKWKSFNWILNPLSKTN